MKAALLLLAVALTGCGFQSDLDAEAARYCGMVEIYEQSGGENGWPPYKGVEQCKNLN